MDTASFAPHCPLLTAGGAAVDAVLRLLVRLLRGGRGREARMLTSWAVSRRSCLMGKSLLSASLLFIQTEYSSEPGQHGRVPRGDGGLLRGDNHGGLLLGDGGGLLLGDDGGLLLGDARRLLLDADGRLLLGGHGRNGRLLH